MILDCKKKKKNKNVIKIMNVLCNEHVSYRFDIVFSHQIWTAMCLLVLALVMAGNIIW
jgi:hypothetical protein